MTELASVPRWCAGDSATVIFPAFDCAVRDAAPARPPVPPPPAAVPAGRPERPEAPRDPGEVDRVPEALVPLTDGADDPELSPPEPVEGEDEPRRGGEIGDPTLGVWTGGAEGVLTDGVVMLGVVTLGVVTGPVVTGGTVTDGTVTDGTVTVGTVTVGTEIVGVETVGIETVGTVTLGTDTVGNAAAAGPPAKTRSAPNAANMVSSRRVIGRPPTRLRTTYVRTRALKLRTDKTPVLFCSPGKPCSLSL